MAPPKGHKLCTCQVCISENEKDPDTLQSMKGQYLPLKRYHQHQKAFPTALSVSYDQPKTKIMSRSDTIPAEPLETLNTSSGSGADTTANSTVPIDKISQSLIMEYETLFHEHVTAFKFPGQLRFTSVSSKPYPKDIQESETFSFSLNRKDRSSANDAIIHFEAGLIQLAKTVNSLSILGDPELGERQQRLLLRIQEKQTEVYKFKAAEWERQRARLEESHQSKDGPIIIPTDIYLDSAHAFSDTQGIIILCLLLALALHFLCHLSRHRSNFVLKMLITIIRHVLGTLNYPEPLEDRLMSSFPSDILKAESLLGLAPILVKYTCCCKCRAMYRQGHEPDSSAHLENPSKANITLHAETCSYKEVARGSACDTPLYRVRILNGKSTKVPRMEFLYQEFPSWLAKFVCRSGMEDKLRRPLLSMSHTPKGVIRNIWDSPAVSTFLGPDKQPFFQDKSRIPLLFGYGFDNFNPFHNKQAGKKTSIGAMFLFCYNLDESIRYLPQNVYIFGVINGPKQPSLTEINHYLELLVNHLLDFYLRGYFFPSTPDSPNGVIVKGVVFPLIMDLHALRQLTGTASYHAKQFCTYCRLQHDNIDNIDPSEWPPWYTSEQHRSKAEAWLYAPTLGMREELFNQNYVRWSELLRLPYFQLDSMCTVEPMHALQNVCKNLVRTTWGIDHNKDSGNGLFVGLRPKDTKAHPTEILNTLVALREKNEKNLLNARKKILYRICEFHELRRIANASILRDIVRNFYNSFPKKLEEDIKRAEAELSSIPVQEVVKLRIRLSQSTKATETVDITAISKFSSTALKSLCKDLGIIFLLKAKRLQMAEALITHHFQYPIVISSADLATGKAVIGADTISELNKDISRTILPSWLSPGPMEFDSSEHGKLTAAEWRTAVLVRLVITLPRLWRDVRRLEMLENFMHLAASLVVISTRAVVTHADVGKETTANVFRREYQAYLEGRVKLYPTGKIQPTEHIMYHIGDKLEYFGPLHYTSANFFERLNGTLQDIPTNMRTGEIEKTLMRVFCTGSNLRTFVDSWNLENSPQESIFQNTLQNVKDIFRDTFCLEAGSRMLQDVINHEESSFFYPQRSDLLSSHQTKLDGTGRNLLWHILEKEYQISKLGITDTSQISIWSLEKTQHQGVWFRQATADKNPTKSHRDSHILVKGREGERPYPCSVRQIIAIENTFVNIKNPFINIFLLVHPYSSLDRTVQEHDPWAKYPLAGGRLYSPSLRKEMEIINIKDIVGHFARTPIYAGEIPGITQECIHVLPLFWHNMFEWIDFLGQTL